MMEDAGRARVSLFDLVAVTLLQLSGVVFWCAVTLTTIDMSSRLRWESVGLGGVYAIWHAGIAANSWILWVGLAAILNHGVPLLAIFGARTERVCLTQVVCSIAGALVLLCGWIFSAAEMLLRS